MCGQPYDQPPYTDERDPLRDADYIAPNQRRYSMAGLAHLYGIEASDPEPPVRRVNIIGLLLLALLMAVAGWALLVALLL